MAQERDIPAGDQPSGHLRVASAPAVPQAPEGGVAQLEARFGLDAASVAEAVEEAMGRER